MVKKKLALIMVSGASLKDIDQIIRLCSEGKYDLAIVGDKYSIQRIGSRIGGLKEKCNIELIVFNAKRPEENALFLATKYSPDIVIDMDKNNTLIHLKNILFIKNTRYIRSLNQ